MSKFKVLSLLFFLLLGCATRNSLSEGTIAYKDLEGGFYGIVDDSGRTYLPVHLPETFKKDGLRVRFKTAPVSGLASVYQWGELVELDEIREA